MSKKLTAVLYILAFVVTNQSIFAEPREIGRLERKCVNEYSAIQKVKNAELTTCKRSSGTGATACQAMYTQHMMPAEEAKVACLNSPEVKEEMAKLEQEAKERRERRRLEQIETEKRIAAAQKAAEAAEAAKVKKAACISACTGNQSQKAACKARC